MKILVSPDRKAVAIESADIYTADDMKYGVFHSQHGGHWSGEYPLQGWAELTVPEPESESAESAADEHEGETFS